MTMLSQAAFRGDSIFTHVFDVGIFGAGHAGFAAAMDLSAKGKSVFIADLRGDLLWESGRTFFSEIGPSAAGMETLVDCSARITGIVGDHLDGVAAEWIANEMVHDAKLAMIYHVAPLAVEREGESLAAVLVASKAGLRRLAARQWIDATETGILARLLAPKWRARIPECLVARILFQKVRWHRSEAIELEVPDLKACRITWAPSHWDNERALILTMPGSEPFFLRHYVPALRFACKQWARDLGGAFVSHASFEPYPVYAASAGNASIANLAIAAPALCGQSVCTLGDRTRLGRQAVSTLAALPRCEGGVKYLRRALWLPVAEKEVTAQIVVAGLGTGGALAALAAAREGAEVLAFEAAAFPGGVGVGAGIPEYYWGCSGGLQAEVDANVREVMPLFASRDHWPRGFHPVAKRVILDELLRAAGVRTVYGALLGAVKRRGRGVETALMATSDGAQSVRAGSWIDATGDGTLCAFAGARFALGRPGDGALQPYTQTGGGFRLEKGRLIATITNPDSGYVNPADSEAMTCARISGIHALMEPVMNAFSRLTHLAPLLGLRQGRQIKTDYMLTLDDLVARRHFPDVVGYTGSHYDNHARDYEFESDDAFFYVACAGLWAAQTACEIPYRMLLPEGLDNVWIACRAAGASEEALHSFRMQRDIQRIGEVCGLAAALAARDRLGSRAVPYGILRERLEKSGALPLGEPDGTDFGKATTPTAFLVPAASLPAAARIARDIKELQEPDFGLALWRLYRVGIQAVGPSLKPWLASRDAMRSWRAAELFAAWGEAIAEPRLLLAMTRREEGAEYDPSTCDSHAGSRGILPRWWAAVTLLRRCGTVKALPALEKLVDDANLPFRVRCAVILTLTRIMERRHSEAATRHRISWLVERLAAVPESVVDQGGVSAGKLGKTVACFRQSLKKQQSKISKIGVRAGVQNAEK